MEKILATTTKSAPHHHEEWGDQGQMGSPSDSPSNAMGYDTLHDSVTALAEKVNDLATSMNTPSSSVAQLGGAHKFSRYGLSTKSVIEGRDTAGVQKSFTAFLRKGDTSGLELKALSAQSDEAGGYAIPEVLSSKIVRTLHERSPLRRLASVTTTTSDSLDFLVDRDIFAAGWAGEIDDRVETDTSPLDKIKIAIHELYAKPRATQKILDDAAINIESWLVEKIADRLSSLENMAFLTGDGQGKPRGILSYETVPSEELTWGKFEHVATGVDGGFQDDDPADVFLQAIERLKGVYHAGACWLMAPGTLGAVRRLKDGDGRYLWQPSLSDKQPSTLFGFPVHICDDMPGMVAGEAGIPVVFGNFKHAYQIVDRKAMTLLRDPFSAKPFVEFYATKRVGGDVVNFEALKMIRCVAAD